MENNPTWTAVVALALRDGEGRWLMHRRPPGKHHGGLWEFPGGKVETGENPADALVREIAEELGIELAACDLAPACFAQEDRNSRPAPIVILLYTCTRWVGAPYSHEGGETGWFAPSEVESLDRPPLDVALTQGLFALHGT